MIPVSRPPTRTSSSTRDQISDGVSADPSQVPATHLDVPAHHAAGGAFHLDARTRDQAIVEAAASYAHTEMQARYDARNPAALKRLVAAGAKVLPFPKAVMDEAFKQSMALYAELSDTNPAWKKIYGDYAAFRKDANLWARFTEATFDRYMQSAKL